MPTIVVGVDFSRHSRHALDWAIKHAILTESKLVVVHAFEKRHSALGVKDGHLDPVGMVEAELDLDEAVELTTKWAKSGRDAGLEVGTVAKGASPQSLILAVAKDENADLIVISTRGQGQIRRALLGSCASSVVSSAECPVVVVPAAAA